MLYRKLVVEYGTDGRIIAGDIKNKLLALDFISLDEISSSEMKNVTQLQITSKTFAKKITKSYLVSPRKEENLPLHLEIQNHLDSLFSYVIKAIGTDLTESFMSMKNIETILYDVAIVVPANSDHEEIGKIVERLQSEHKIKIVGNNKETHDVTIMINNVLVLEKGITSIYGLIFNDNHSRRNKFLDNMNVLIYDIDRWTTEASIYKNLNPTSYTKINLGYNPSPETLAQKIIKLPAQTDSFRSLLEYIKKPQNLNLLSKDNHVHKVVFEEIHRLASIHHSVIEKIIMENSMDVCYVVGEGASIFQPIIEEFLHENTKVKFFFNNEDAVWLDLKGCFHLLDTQHFSVF